MKNNQFRQENDARSRWESRVQEQLSTPKFGTLYHFIKVSSDDFKVST